MRGKNTALLVTIILMVIFGSFTVTPLSINDSNYFITSQPFVSGEIIIGLTDEIDIEDLEVNQPDPIHGLKIKKINDKIDFIVLECEKQKEDFYIDLYQSSESVRYAEKNIVIKLEYEPDDPAWDRQYGPKNIKCPEAWDTTKGSKDVVIAIVDSGIDYTHPDLEANMWTNNQGYHGYDFIDDDNTPLDELGHGTHCAGIAAAVMDDYGIAGVAQVSIMSVRVLDGDGSSHGVSGIADGIIYAADNGADVISMSIGSYTPATPMRDACSYAWDAGVVLVASAGNDDVSWAHYPSDYSSVMSVGATDENNERAFFSNWGTNVDVMAPGLGIYSTIPGNDYDYKSGTSMSCPHVAGVAALAKSRNPSWTNQQIRQKIYDSADPLGDEGSLWKYGLVDATLDGENSPVVPHVDVEIISISNEGSGLDAIDTFLNEDPEWFYEVTVEHDEGTESATNFNFKPNPTLVETEYLKYYIEKYESEVSDTNTWEVEETHSFKTPSPIVTVKIKVMEDDFVFDWFSDVADISSRNNPGGDDEFGWDERGRIFTAKYDLVNDDLIKSESDRYEEEYEGLYYTRGDWDGSTKAEGFDWKQDDALLWFKITDNYVGLIANAGGPYIGKVGETIELRGTVQGGIEPYSYQWDLDNDGTYEIEGQSITHSWDESGEYPIKFRVMDFFSQFDTAETTVTIDKNNAPGKPTISGPESGSYEDEHTYSFKSTDSENDYISYYVEWGDSSDSGWTEAFPSGKQLSLSHKWDSQGMYVIRAKAKDADGAESGWQTLSVKMPKTHTKNRLILQDLFDKLAIFKIFSNNKGKNFVTLLTNIFEKI